MKTELKQEYFIKDKAMGVLADRIETGDSFIKLYHKNKFISHIYKKEFKLIFKFEMEGTIYLEIEEIKEDER